MRFFFRCMWKKAVTLYIHICNYDKIILFIVHVVCCFDSNILNNNLQNCFKEYAYYCKSVSLALNICLHDKICSYRKRNFKINC